MEVLSFLVQQEGGSEHLSYPGSKPCLGGHLCLINVGYQLDFLTHPEGMDALYTYPVVLKPI